MRADGLRSARERVQATLPSQRRFWLAIGLIILGGAALRVLIHDYGLPWYEEIDELRIYYIGRQLRGVPERHVPLGEYVGYYPPAITWLHRLAQPWAEAQGRMLASDTIVDLRRFILALNLLGILWIAMLARRVGGATAGILAAAMWAFDRFMLRTTVFAIGEAIAAPLLILSLLLALQALEPGRRRWLLASGSIITGLVCLLAEYRLAVAVLPGAAALVWYAWQRYRPGWRRAALWASAGVLLLTLATLFMLTILPQRFADIAASTLGNHLWDLKSFLHHFEEGYESLPAGLLPAFLVLVFLFPGGSVDPKALSRRWPALLLTGAIMLLSLWAVSSIHPYFHSASPDRLWERHLLPAVSMLYVLTSAALIRILASIPRRRLRTLVAVGLLAILLPYQLSRTWAMVKDYRVLSWPIIVRQWLDDNVEPGTILVYHKNERWFNPLWHDYQHRQWFDWWPTDTLPDHSLRELRETHRITWALLPALEHDELQRSAEGRFMLDQMLLLRSFTAPPQRREHETVLYRLWRMQQESDVRFGDHIRLVGYDLHDPDPLPGEPVAFTFYWNAPTRPPENYSLFLHLVAGEGTSPFAQVDGNPAVPERLTQTWDRADETLISPRFTLTLPPDLAPGDYRILFGLYNFETGARLPLQDAQGALLGDAWEVTRLRIPDS